MASTEGVLDVPISGRTQEGEKLSETLGEGPASEGGDREKGDALGGKEVLLRKE